MRVVVVHGTAPSFLLPARGEKVARREEGSRMRGRASMRLSSVMAGLVPAIHVFVAADVMRPAAASWMAGTRPAMTSQNSQGGP
ncbi:hypothetical protein CCR97_26905 [Rhodoplanes elegans]|nr:hypothetical protein [Rhodoplanes elegans]